MGDFYHYMFAPVGQPFYTGAFWSNEVQWLSVIVLSALCHAAIAVWVDRRHQRRHRDLLQRLGK